MTKKVFSVIFILAAAAFLSFFIFSNQSPSESQELVSNPPSSLTSSDNSINRSIDQSIISLFFKFPSETKNFEVQTDGTLTLFELIEKTDLKIETENFPPMGKMITSINGLKNGTDGKYWQYWINGEYAQIGVSAFKPSPSDRIQWRFTKEKPG